MGWCWSAILLQQNVQLIFSYSQKKLGMVLRDALWRPGCRQQPLLICRKKSCTMGTACLKMGIRLSLCSWDLVQVCDLPLLIWPLPVYPSQCILHMSGFFLPCILFESNKPVAGRATPLRNPQKPFGNLLISELLANYWINAKVKVVMDHTPLGQKCKLLWFCRACLC